MFYSFFLLFWCLALLKGLSGFIFFGLLTEIQALLGFAVDCDFNSEAPNTYATYVALDVAQIYQAGFDICCMDSTYQDSDSISNTNLIFDWSAYNGLILFTIICEAPLAYWGLNSYLISVAFESGLMSLVLHRTGFHF